MGIRYQEHGEAVSVGSVTSAPLSTLSFGWSDSHYLCAVSYLCSLHLVFYRAPLDLFLLKGDLTHPCEYCLPSLLIVLLLYEVFQYSIPKSSMTSCAGN